MFTRVELIAAGGAVAVLVVALILLQQEPRLGQLASETQLAGVGSALQVVNETAVPTIDTQVTEPNMQIEDITIGSGEVVKAGDTVFVHYEGTLTNGQLFDSSKRRGEPFSFTVGAGQVIAGWEQGLIGMQIGGERKLVIPPELAYGERGIGPIPPNATLMFTIELIDIQ